MFLDNIKLRLKTEVKATINFLICSCVKNTESIPYKRIDKQFININFDNISADKCLHFCIVAKDDPKNFLQLKLTSTVNFFPRK